MQDTAAAAAFPPPAAAISAAAAPPPAAAILTYYQDKETKLLQQLNTVQELLNQVNDEANELRCVRSTRRDESQREVLARLEEDARDAQRNVDAIMQQLQRLQATEDARLGLASRQPQSWQPVLGLGTPQTPQFPKPTKVPDGLGKFTRGKTSVANFLTKLENLCIAREIPQHKWVLCLSQSMASDPDLDWTIRTLVHPNCTWQEAKELFSREFGSGTDEQDLQAKCIELIRTHKTSHIGLADLLSNIESLAAASRMDLQSPLLQSLILQQLRGTTIASFVMRQQQAGKLSWNEFKRYTLQEGSRYATTLQGKAKRPPVEQISSLQGQSEDPLPSSTTREVRQVLSAQARALHGPCRDFARGACLFGDTCRYEHGDRIARPMLAAAGVTSAAASMLAQLQVDPDILQQFSDLLADAQVDQQLLSDAGPPPLPMMAAAVGPQRA